MEAPPFAASHSSSSLLLLRKKPLSSTRFSHFGNVKSSRNFSIRASSSGDSGLFSLLWNTHLKKKNIIFLGFGFVPQPLIFSFASWFLVVTLLDYGAGNVRSVRNAIRSLGFDIEDVSFLLHFLRGLLLLLLFFLNLKQLCLLGANPGRHFKCKTLSFPGCWSICCCYGGVKQNWVIFIFCLFSLFFFDDI